MSTNHDRLAFLVVTRSVTSASIGASSAPPRPPLPMYRPTDDGDLGRVARSGLARAATHQVDDHAGFFAPPPEAVIGRRRDASAARPSAEHHPPVAEIDHPVQLGDGVVEAGDRNQGMRKQSTAIAVRRPLDQRIVVRTHTGPMELGVTEVQHVEPIGGKDGRRSTPSSSISWSRNRLVYSPGRRSGYR